MSLLHDISEYITLKLLIALILTTLLFPIIVLYSTISTSLHAHRKHKSKLSYVVSVLVLIVVLMCLFLIPLDITNSNSGMDLGVWYFNGGKDDHKWIYRNENIYGNENNNTNMYRNLNRNTNENMIGNTNKYSNNILDCSKFDNVQDLEKNIESHCEKKSQLDIKRHKDKYSHECISETKTLPFHSCSFDESNEFHKSQHTSQDVLNHDSQVAPQLDGPYDRLHSDASQQVNSQDDLKDLTIDTLDPSIVRTEDRTYVYGLPFKILYVTLFATMGALIFFLVPFAYFFYEAGDSEIRLHHRIISSLKYTIFTIVALIILLIIAIVLGFLNTIINRKGSSHDIESYVMNTISIIIAVMASMGLIPYLIFTGCGLGSLPLSILGRIEKRVSTQLDTIEEEQDMISERLEALRNIRSFGKTLNRKQSQEFKSLLEKRSLLERKEKKVQENKKRHPLKRIFLMLLKVIKGITSILIAIVVTLVLISLFISTLFRGLSSKCYFLCGFQASKVLELHVSNSFYWLVNPLDFILVMSSRLFPLDMVILIGLLGLFIWSTMEALRNFWAGIWKLLCIQCYSMAWRKTHPQGLLFRSIIFMFTMITLFIFLFSFAPQYIAFGGQQYLDQSLTWRYCNIEHLSESVTASSFNLEGVFTNNARPCYLSEIGELTLNVHSVMWGIFGTLFYFSNILFLLFSAGGFIVSIFWLLPKREAISVEDESDSESSTSDYTGIQ